MTYYNDIYMRRLNRFGKTYQERRLEQRKAEFHDRLLKSSYRVNLEYEGREFLGSFERYKQDETEALHYLLTETEQIMPNGTILQVPMEENGLVKRPWMIYYMEDQQFAAYNRYIMLKMTHIFKWIDREGLERKSYCYLYGQEDNMLKDELRSRSRSGTLYKENLKLSFCVLPRNGHIKKQDLIFIGSGDLFEQYVVSGYDIQSTPGVEYVSIDPTYARDMSKIPVNTNEDNNDEFFWLTGGDSKDGN